MTEMEKSSYRHHGLIYQPGDIHPRINVPFWLDFLKQKEYFAGPSHDPLSPIDHIVGLCRFENYRKTCKFEDVKNECSTDLILWGKGKPKEPYSTKLGGVPFLDKAKPWPTKNGVRAKFVGQVNFQDSLDVVKCKLPGDLMLLFDFGEDFIDEEFVVIWENITATSPRLNDNDCPNPHEIKDVLFGALHRTKEFETGSIRSWFTTLNERNGEVYECSKIGGRYRDIQSFPLRFLKGQHFLYLRSFQLGYHFPFVNDEGPGEISPCDRYQEDLRVHRLRVGDAGAVGFFRNLFGRVTYRIDSY